MKTLDLNIDIQEIKIFDEKTKEIKEIIPPLQVTINTIKAMLVRALNKTDPITNKPTIGVSTDDNIQYYLVISKIKNNEKGIVNLDNDDCKWVQQKFSDSFKTLPIEDNTNEILVKIKLMIDKAMLGE